ncbi:glutamine synthetase family protein [Streptomyces sp. NPDC050610]|uniref:glutamine synthetase family protein n=1 Tax=Streptomyces sp. NPDC050610 TaxID=3157097 RepID=UPI003419388F
MADGSTTEARTGEQQRIARQEAARLTAEGVHVIALTWVDNAGIARVKAVPTARLAAVAHRGVGMSPIFDVYTFDDYITASPHLGGPDGDLRLFPDLGRLTVLAAQPGWAWAPVDRYEQDGTPYPACQRQFARRMADRAAAAGLEVRMGFETEWAVSRPAPDDGFDAACAGPGYGMTRVVELSDYVRAVAEALDAQGIEVLQIHPEYGAGQFEVSTAPADPVRAADDAVLVRETVRAVSARHGMRAAFAPSVVAGDVGNGCHLHLSLHRDGRSLHRESGAPYGLDLAAVAFLGGVLDALPALSAVGAPSPASYVRIVPSQWAGAYRCWGVENREAALRLVQGAWDDPDGGNAEIKCVDAAANPYLLVGAVIAEGLNGVSTGAKLPPPVVGDPGRLSEPERRERAIDRLPTTLSEATGLFERQEVLRDAMGEVLHGAFAAVRRAEAERSAGSSPEEIVATTRWRY